MDSSYDAKTVANEGQELELTVDTLVSDGRGLGRSEGLVVLIRDALPGQRVRVCIDSVRRRMAEGHVLAVLETSPWQREPLCTHTLCGGCDWQSLVYDQQLEWKTRMVKDALERLGRFENPEVLPALASPEEWGYRNKMEFAFALSGESGKLSLGLRQRRSRDVVDVTDCRLQSPLTMQVVRLVREFAPQWNLPAWDAETRSGFWRFLVVREPVTGGCLVEVITAPYQNTESVRPLRQSKKPTPEQIEAQEKGQVKAQAFVRKLGKDLAQIIRSALPAVTGFVLSQRVAWSDVAYGESVAYSEGQIFLTERIHCDPPKQLGISECGELALHVGPQSFFQVNTGAAEILYAEVARMLDLQGTEVVWDLFCGVGAIGLSLAMGRPGPAEVYGLETLNRAVELARTNAREAGLAHCHFETGDARTAAKRFPQPQAVVVDPPRAGLHEELVRDLVRIAPQKLVYVSCNPATLARDAALLARRFTLVRVQPVDLFPQTPHVECAALFELS